MEADFSIEKSKGVDENMKLSRLRMNYEENPVGITGTPVFSWVLESEVPDTMQEAFSLEILTGGEPVYASGKRTSGQSVGFEPEGFAVLPARQYQWKLHVWSNHGEEAQAEAQFEGGIEAWRAAWIEPANDGLRYEKPIGMIAETLFHSRPKGTVEERLMPVSILQKKFFVKPGLKQARAYVTAHGLYQLQLNGQLPDERRFAPECSAYEKVLYYQVYAVTELLQAGENTCRVLLADGWWGGRVGMTGEAGQYGWSRGLLLQLELVYENGETEYVCSDESFQWCDDGRIRYADLSIGEKQDHNFSLSQARWKPVRTANYGYENLFAQIGPPVRVVQELRPELLHTPKGEAVLDFGQNFAGVVRCRLRCAKGTAVTLEHAETLDEQGNVFFSITGVNKDQKDVFVCAGTGEEIFEPQFTYHGFRYVRITGLDSVDPADFTGLVLSSDMENLSAFSCSDARLNRLYQNACWSQWSNMVSIPTDCPHREKAGWTGDIQVFAPTAAYHQDVNGFLSRWMQSVQAEQLANGAVPAIVPYTACYQKIMKEIFRTDVSCGWSDACVIVPYVLYQMYGNEKVLKDFYPVMRKWLAFVEKEAAGHVSKDFRKKRRPSVQERENQRYLWNTGFHFGDWMVPSLESKKFSNGTVGYNKTHEPLLSTMYYAFDLSLMQQIAAVLGKTDEAENDCKQLERVKQAFAQTYITPDGELTQKMQGIYACALWFDLIPENAQARIVGALIDMIRGNGTRLDTGFLGTPVLLEVLAKYGHLDLAYELLYQNKMPSWLYEVEHGTTTIWESWGAIGEDGKPKRISFNHYAFGCVSDFMQRYLIGIDKQQPGYQRILIRPQPDETLTWAQGSYQSVYGRIESKWSREPGSFCLEVTIPCNTKAEVVLPDGAVHHVGSGTHSFQCAWKRR